MDEGDISVELYEAFLNRSLHNAQDNFKAIQIRLEQMQKAGIANRCMYCEEHIDHYDSAFCANEDDWSCSDEYERLKQSEKRVMKVVDYD